MQTNYIDIPLPHDVGVGADTGVSLSSSSELVPESGRKELIRSLKRADLQSKKEFSRLVTQGFRALRLRDKELAWECGVSLPTVTRWKSGSSVPILAVRKFVYAWLLRLAWAMENEENGYHRGSDA